MDRVSWILVTTTRHRREIAASDGCQPLSGKLHDKQLFLAEVLSAVMIVTKNHELRRPPEDYTCFMLK